MLEESGHRRPPEQIREATSAAGDIFMPRYRELVTSGKATDASELLQMWEVGRPCSETSRSWTVQRGHQVQVIPGWDESLALYPETVEAVERLRSDGYRLGMVSNGVNQGGFAGALGIAGYFEVIVGSAHVGFSKPPPQIYKLALSRLDITPEEALMVGDNWPTMSRAPGPPASGHPPRPRRRALAGDRRDLGPDGCGGAASRGVKITPRPHLEGAAPLCYASGRSGCSAAW